MNSPLAPAPDHSATGTQPATLSEVLTRRARTHGERIAYTYLSDGETEEQHITYAELDRRSRQVAGALRKRHLPGERALLVYPSGLDYLIAFFACLRAGLLAVPVYPPRLIPGRTRGDQALHRIRGVITDATPSVLLTTATLRERLERVVADLDEFQNIAWFESDASPSKGDPDATLEPIDPDRIAFLQYTSGSTGSPRGVRISHANLMANQRMIRDLFDRREGTVVVGWLPLYHDMGLIGQIMQPLYMGGRCIFLSPAAFLQRPIRWLDAITRYRADISPAPNFAYDLCVQRIKPELRERLDLSSWTAALNGAEPVRPGTLQRFAEYFAPAGFRARSFYPCYGLAEATLVVTGGQGTQSPYLIHAEGAELARGHLKQTTEPGPGTRTLVGSGRPAPGTRVSIVDTATGTELPPGRVGSIIVRGPGVAAGYWNATDTTTFREDGDGPLLDTGDLGFLLDDHLFITGRAKDVIIIDGRNLYPQDIEASAEAADDELRTGGSAAFAVDAEDGERLVIACEVEPRCEPERFTELKMKIRSAVAAAHDVRPGAVILLRPGNLPRTTSGKIRRFACRDLYPGGGMST